ncbi:MAG: imidazole glycerol phosphate synthase subunit HisF [Robiginitomaculum sp.]
MLTRRIIPCLDVRDGKVVKGVQFRNHEVVGDILDLALRYRDAGADELVFYDITASVDDRTISPDWVREVSKLIDIPFCVAGGIKTVEEARARLEEGADKISINSPALMRPDLINELSTAFGAQCIVAGIDSFSSDGAYQVKSHTGAADKTRNTGRGTLKWVEEVIARGAGEVVLNCMNKDGVRDGYDIKQLKAVRRVCTVPLIASGGAGKVKHFADVFKQANVDGALAASVFHKNILPIPDLKLQLRDQEIEIRI